MAHRDRHLPLLLVLTAAACQSAPGSEDRSDPLTDIKYGVVIDWSVPKRTFPPGITCTPMLEPSNPEFMNPPSWPVRLDGCQTHVPEEVQTMTWEVEVPGSPTIRASGCKADIQVPQLGTYKARFTVTTDLAVTYVVERDIVVQDYLIVSIGDSVASGEGNPDRPSAQARDVYWDNAACHRSWKSGPARAAVELEELDPHSSVTFVSTACTGDSIGSGILSSRGGRTPQMDRIAQLTGGRTIDALLVSAGANDIGFGEVVSVCANPFIRQPCWQHRTDVGDFGNVAGIDAPDFGEWIARNIRDLLPRRYDALADRIKDLGRVKHVVLSEYPDPTQDGSGRFCEIRLKDAGRLAPYHADKIIGKLDGDITPDEAKWAWGNVVLPLNDKVTRAVDRHGWKLARVESQTAWHGYCTAEPWTTKFEESFDNQADEMGVLHPNAAGHKHYAKLLVEQVRPIMARTLEIPRVVEQPDRHDTRRCLGSQPTPPPRGQPAYCKDDYIRTCDAQTVVCKKACADSVDFTGGDVPMCECECDNAHADCIGECGGFTGTPKDCRR